MIALHLWKLQCCGSTFIGLHFSFQVTQSQRARQRPRKGFSGEPEGGVGLEEGTVVHTGHPAFPFGG